jgi:hypothetical protein
VHNFWIFQPARLQPCDKPRARCCGCLDRNGSSSERCIPLPAATNPWLPAFRDIIYSEAARQSRRALHTSLIVRITPRISCGVRAQAFPALRQRAARRQLHAHVRALPFGLSSAVSAPTREWNAKGRGPQPGSSTRTTLVAFRVYPCRTLSDTTRQG